MSNSTAAPAVPAETRKQALARAIATEVYSGWSVESQSDYQAVMIKRGTRTNHVLHLILTILTGGLWLFVWIGLAIVHRADKHLVLSVDEFGNIRR